MKKNYVTPELEIIEIEIQDAILSLSNLEYLYEGETLG